MISNAHSASTLDQGTSKSQSMHWEIEVFFDGDCPLCVREIGMLRRKDRKRKIRFTDISVPQFRPDEVGKDLDTLMAEIHGRSPNGEWITGVEVFRQLYAAVGFSPLVALTRLPLVSHGLELGYRIFARNRLRLTGRCNQNACAMNKS